MQHNKPDRRTAKTRRAIVTAMSELMQEMKYSNITVQDIIDRANIGRSTFYAHFNTKDELLSVCIGIIFDGLHQFVADSVENSSEQSRILPVAELFEHVKDNKRLIKGLMSVENIEVLHIVQSLWNEKINDYLMKRVPNGMEPRIPLELLINHISGTMIDMLRWWVESDHPYTPQQMDRFFQELIDPCVNSVLSGELPGPSDAADSSVHRQSGLDGSAKAQGHHAADNQPSPKKLNHRELFF